MLQSLRERLVIPEEFGGKVYDLLHPGSLLFATAQGSTEKTRTKASFLIMRVAEE